MNGRVRSGPRAFGTTIVALCVLVGLGCGDDDSSEPGSPTRPTTAAVARTPTPSATPTRTIDPDAVSIEGTIIVLNRHRDGHPRQIGVEIEPIEGTVWTTGGKELIYLWDGPFERSLNRHVGQQVKLRGTLRRGFDSQATIFAHSYELGGVSYFPNPPGPATSEVTAEGVVVVVDRFEGGHPRTLGLRPDNGDPLKLGSSNKSRELRYRIGERVRLHGTLRGDADTLDVGAYEELEPGRAIGPGDGFRKSFLAGGLDRAGNFMGGVEVDTMEIFDGRIFAGISYRRNTNVDSGDPPPPGAQVLVLDRFDARWRVDFTVTGDAAGISPRIVSLKRVTFSTDTAGNPLTPPVEMLAAVGGNGELYLRSGGEPADWVATGLPQQVLANTTTTGRRPDARSVASHVDRETGISHVFVGAFLSGRRGDGAGVYRGSFDPDAPGLIEWAATPDYPFTATREEPWRVMGLTTANGAVYASLGKLLLRRNDGTEPTWTEVFRDPLQSGRDSVREAAALRLGNAGDNILFGIEGPNSRVVRLDPADRHRPTVEVNTVQRLGPAIYGIIGYNGPAGRSLGDGQSALVLGMELLRIRADFGLGIQQPDLGRFYEWSDGLVLWRAPDGGYTLNRIFDRTMEVHPPLVGVRAVLGQSPFRGEEDIAYLGGFDHNGHLSHNTAWIFKVHLDDLRDGILALDP